MLELATDQELLLLLVRLTHSWEVAMSRLEQIGQEREREMYDDDGVEVMPVYIRIERVFGLMVELTGHPQAVLLRSVAERLRVLAEDTRMFAEAALLMTPRKEEAEIEPMTIWERLWAMKPAGGGDRKSSAEMVERMFLKNVMPHQEHEEAMATMRALTDESEPDKEKLLGVAEAGADLHELSKAVTMLARGSRQLMGIGLLSSHLWADIIYNKVDMMQMDDADVSDKFEEAKHDLMESRAWGDYWVEHEKHLRQLGDKNKQLAEDAKEVESWLVNMHGYLYNKWNEGPEAFGEALKCERLDDEQMLMLLFYLAKKEMLARKAESPAVRRRKMEKAALEAAMKLRELADDEYYMDYEAIWTKIVKNDELARLLMDYSVSKYNKGFNMMCLCKIVAYLHREHRFYGSHSAEDLGKGLRYDDVKNSQSTFFNYIKKRETMLNDQCYNELDEILKNK